MERICSLELPPVVGVAVSNHHLGRVLVGHHDSWLRELRPRCLWVVRHEWLLMHASMLDGMHLVSLFRPGRRFRGSLGVLVRSGCLPASLLQWELDGHCLAILAQDVRTGLNPGIGEVRR